jgi:hypothetical protein
MRPIRAAVFCSFAAAICLTLSAFSGPQDSNLAPAILACVIGEPSGPWVHADRYRGNPILFNYSYEGPNPKPGPEDYRDGQNYVYAAFWNRDRTSGEFLQFVWFRAEPRTHLRIVNNADIVSSHGRLDLEDALWGAWTYEHLKKRLLKLKVAPAETVSLDKTVDAKILCDSYVRPISGPSPGAATRQ